MKNDDNFFDDILNDDDNEDNLFHSIEETEFDFEDDIDAENIETDSDIPFDVDEPKPSKNENYKRSKDDIQDSVAELQGNINSMLKTISKQPDDMFAENDLLPGLDLNIVSHDYDKDIELIKIESKETLECLANLYLTEDIMKTKNVYKIIKDDSASLSKLSFSIEMAQRAMIGCMRQLDMGVNDPLMYQAVAMFQKEMRETIKMAYELQRKMKDFYKELKQELTEINSGEELEIDEEHYTVIGDPKMLNDLFEEMKKDPTLLSEMLDHDKDKKKK